MSLLVVKSVVCHNKTPAITMVTCVSSLIIETDGGSRNSLVREQGKWLPRTSVLLEAIKNWTGEGLVMRVVCTPHVMTTTRHGCNNGARMTPSVMLFLPSLVVLGDPIPCICLFSLWKLVCIYTQAHCNNTQFSVGVITLVISQEWWHACGLRL